MKIIDPKNQLCPQSQEEFLKLSKEDKQRVTDVHQLKLVQQPEEDINYKISQRIKNAQKNIS